MILKNQPTKFFKRFYKKILIRRNPPKSKIVKRMAKRLKYLSMKFLIELPKI